MNLKSKNSGIKYKVIGLMSGTSLDGLDIALCTFTKREKGWKHQIDCAETISYSSTWLRKLRTAQDLPAENLLQLHSEYGALLGEAVKAFIQKNKLKGIHFISSHGHTIFHQPPKGFTFQLGDGNSLYAVCGLPVVCDFRSLDVALGGQGAPLVPIGDKLLFNEYDVCLNLGGIANLSKEYKGERVAYDICFANMGLNFLANLANKKYDIDGFLAEQGEVNARLLQNLSKKYNLLRIKRPSLGREIFEKQFQPLLEDSSISLHDRMRTFTESIAQEISLALGNHESKQILCTGGGVFNRFLMYRLVELCGDANVLIMPDEEVVKFKEALVFALLGVLKVAGEINVLKSVTKANKNSSSGVMTGFY